MGSKIVMYAQDPDFSGIDKAFLAELDIKIVHEPEGQALLNYQTFVYGPFVPHDLAATITSRRGLEAPCLLMTHSQVWITNRTYIARYAAIRAEAKKTFDELRDEVKEQQESTDHQGEFTAPAVALQLHETLSIYCRILEGQMAGLLWFLQNRSSHDLPCCPSSESRCKTCMNIHIDHRLLTLEQRESYPLRLEPGWSGI
ncbi:hypothetical protein QBC35DRAFT_450600 [Podospora australis]|uniref:SRR1-like domain-containing protein n=1 Tax=Podospora australis TaxID=1536484 RepID=A0AAN7AHT6_9PEZI|nr:hypothetical protein QBC35DRAFT_450600 [Podospora australis]